MHQYNPKGHARQKDAERICVQEAQPPEHLSSIVHRYLEIKTIAPLDYDFKFEAYGTAGALVKADYAKPGTGGPMIYFGVEDCTRQETLLPQTGGQVIRSKYSIGEYGFVVLGQDSEGNHIGFNSMT